MLHATDDRTLSHKSNLVVYVSKYQVGILHNLLMVSFFLDFAFCPRVPVYVCAFMFEMAINRKRVEGEIRQLYVLIPVKSRAPGVRWGDRRVPL